MGTWMPIEIGKIDRVLHDVDLGREVRGNVDCSIRYDQGMRHAWYIEHENMGEAPPGAKPGLLVQSGAKQIIRMQMTLHQRFRPTGPDQFDPGIRGFSVAVDLDHLETGYVRAQFRGGGRDLVPVPDQDRRNDRALRGQDCTAERVRFLRADDGRRYGGSGSAILMSASKWRWR